MAKQLKILKLKEEGVLQKGDLIYIEPAGACEVVRVTTSREVDVRPIRGEKKLIRIYGIELS